MPGSISEADPTDLVDFADVWARLDMFHRDHVRIVLGLNKWYDSPHPNVKTIRWALEQLGGRNRRLDQALKEWLDREVKQQGSES